MSTATDKPSQAPVAVACPICTKPALLYKASSEYPVQLIACEHCCPDPEKVMVYQHYEKKLSESALCPPPLPMPVKEIDGEEMKRRYPPKAEKPWPSEFPINDPRNTCGAY